MASERRERRLLASSMAAVKANLVVAKDGTGHFKTVQAKPKDNNTDLSSSTMMNPSPF